MDIPLLENERIDDLMRGGLRIIQRTDAFRFGTDAVLLADFAHAKKNARCCDLGTGTGILPLLIYAREPSAAFDAIEIQPGMAGMAARSVALNGLAGRIRVIQGDMRDIKALLPRAQYDMVVCNPPYGKAGASLRNPDGGLCAARHESLCELPDITRAAAWLLRNGGKLQCVFPAARMLELFDEMRLQRIEPKRVRLVHSAIGKPPHLCLADGVLNARPGLHMLPPLVIYGEDGRYTAEVAAIYGLRGD